MTGQLTQAELTQDDLIDTRPTWPAFFNVSSQSRMNMQLNMVDT